MVWAAAKDTLIAGFDTRADRQQVLRSFRTTQLRVGLETLSHAVALRVLLNRALPTLDDVARLDGLLERFMENLPEHLREKAWIVNAEKTIDVEL
ncbi:unnamed protein product [Echinostoma caproni]|uniref:Transposase n=1 Tax=Echinostoma caproni TaxID=27848 RepID=A0A183AZ79_9TREM|nr:unnamed protein product [Echinostoma caproni]